MALDANGCEIVKIDSNLSGLAIAEEKCLRELPVSPVWFGIEPNTYSDFGQELSKVTRSPIDPSRQNKKGTVVDIDASGGFNADKTRSNLLRLLQGFMFADARERFTTKSLLSAQVPVTDVDATAKTIAFAGANNVKAGDIVMLEGFGLNSGARVVVSSTATEIEVVGNLFDEVPPATATVSVVGFELGAGDASIVKTGNVISMAVVAGDLTTHGLIPGMWVFVGDDAAANHFDNNGGFARINSVTAKSVVFDDVAWYTGKAPEAEAGAGKQVRVFVPTVIRNEKDPALIKRRSYSIERTLGMGEVDTQAEYLEGAVPNEFTLNIPQGDKLNADLTFVACEVSYRSGDIGDKIKTGARVPVEGGDALNTTSDIYRMKMSILDPLTSTPTPLFGYVTEATIAINNNVTPIKVVGRMGAVDVSLGNFEVSGDLTVLFTTTSAVQAIKRNADVSFNTIMCSNYSGFVFDAPLIGLGGGRLNVEKDSPITVPLESAGAENKNGYTLMYNYFARLPGLAMPQ